MIQVALLVAVHAIPDATVTEAEIGLPDTIPPPSTLTAEGETCGGGGSVTVKAILLLTTPFTVTFTFPVAAPPGTVVAILVELQVVAVAATPLNVTLFPPAPAPKFVPLIVTGIPTGPDDGDSPPIDGGGAATPAAHVPTC